MVVIRSLVDIRTASLLTGWAYFSEANTDEAFEMPEHRNHYADLAYPVTGKLASLIYLKPGSNVTVRRFERWSEGIISITNEI